MTDDEIRDNDRKDRDETRRLLYMGLTVNRTEHFELAGTLINAIRHHQGVGDDLLEDRIVALLEEGEPASETWAREQIDRLTGEISAGD